MWPRDSEEVTSLGAIGGNLHLVTVREEKKNNLKEQRRRIPVNYTMQISVGRSGRGVAESALCCYTTSCADAGVLVCSSCGLAQQLKGAGFILLGFSGSMNRALNATPRSSSHLGFSRGRFAPPVCQKC